MKNSGFQEWLDGLMPNSPWLVKWLLIYCLPLVVIFFLSIWLSGFQEYDNYLYWTADWFNRPWQYIMTIVGLLVFDVFYLAALRSEGVIDVLPNHTRQKVPAMLKVFGIIIFLVNVACVMTMVASAKH